MLAKLEPAADAQRDGLLWCTWSANLQISTIQRWNNVPYSSFRLKANLKWTLDKSIKKNWCQVCLCQPGKSETTATWCVILRKPVRLFGDVYTPALGNVLMLLSSQTMHVLLGQLRTTLGTIGTGEAVAKTFLGGDIRRLLRQHLFDSCWDRYQLFIKSSNNSLKLAYKPWCEKGQIYSTC